MGAKVNTGNKLSLVIDAPTSTGADTMLDNTGTTGGNLRCQKKYRAAGPTRA